jgi:hypothetical protein
MPLGMRNPLEGLTAYKTEELVPQDGWGFRKLNLLHIPIKTH